MLDWLFPPPSRQQVIALAGVFQACTLVDSFARLGTAHPEEFKTAMYSLFQQNPQSTEAVYQNLGKLELGLESLCTILKQPKTPDNIVLLRYVLGVLYIARKMSANTKMMDRIGDGIANGATQAEHFSLNHDNVIANIADLYQKTISTLNFRIQVSGVASNLQQKSIASRIRCLLFSAVRSAFLWQQLNGSRFHLMFRRSSLLKYAEELKHEAHNLNN